MLVVSGLPGVGTAPTWADVSSRVYEPWTEPRLLVDTAQPLATCEHEIDDYLRAGVSARIGM